MDNYNVLEWLEKAGYAAGRGAKSAYTRISKNIGLEKADFVKKDTLIKILKECPKKDIIKKLISSLDNNQNELLINEEPINEIDPNPNNIKSLQRVYYMEDKGFVDRIISTGLGEVLMLEGIFENKVLNIPLSKLKPREAEEKVWTIPRTTPVREEVKKTRKKKTK